MKAKMLAIAMLVLSTLLWAGDNVAVKSPAFAGAPGSTEAVLSAPKMLSFQGKLTDTLGLPVADTTHSVTFRLYAVSSGGSAFWNETQTVRTRGGLFSTLLGSVSQIESVPGAGNLYLGVQVGASELAPRLRIVSGAYSYLSRRADTANYALSSGAQENAWTRGTPDSVLFTAHYLGVARGGAGNSLYGSYRYTHVNLGNSSTTGINGQNNDFATVAGGFGGIAGGPCATVGGGHSDTARAYAATVAGGFGNHAAGAFSAVGGGQANSVAGTAGTVAGGYGNSAAGDSAFVGGGAHNAASQKFSTVGGGSGNQATSWFTTVGGGSGNYAAGSPSTVGGGAANHADGDDATVSGGRGNHAGFAAAVGGGQSNYAESSYATVGGGYFNDADGRYSTVPGGYAASASHYGEFAHASGCFVNHGDAQASEYVLRAQGAGDVTLTLDGGAPGSANGLKVYQNRDVVYDVLVVTNANSQAAGFRIQCVVKDVGGSTSMVGSPSVTTIASDNPDFGVWAWVANNALWVGAHSDEVARWVATVRTAELNW